MLVSAPRMKRKKHPRRKGLRRTALLVGSLAATSGLNMCASNSLWLGTAVEEVADVSQNVKQYHAAARRNDRDAQFRLGCCYLDGLGVSPNRTEALYWLKQAAAQGHRDARALLRQIS